MKTDGTILKWIGTIISDTLSKLNQVNFFQVCLFLFVLFCLYVIYDHFRHKPKKNKKINQKNKSKKVVEKKTEMSIFRKETAHLYYFYYKDKSPSPKPRLKGFYSAEIANTPGQPSKKTLFMLFNNKERFFFKGPKILQEYQVAMLNKAKNDLKKKRKLDFNWMGQSMKILHCGHYDAKANGNYPHFVHNKNQASLLLARKNDSEIVEESWGEFYFFEEIKASEITTWQKEIIRCWTGGPLSEEEFRMIQPNYSDPETKEVSLNVK